MANMSYCRFHNTLIDLYDCQSALEDFIENDENVISSREERYSAECLIALCKEISDRYEEADIRRQSEYFDQEENEEANDEYCQEEEDD